MEETAIAAKRVRVSDWRIHPAIGLFLLLMVVSENALAQAYPRWFLDPAAVGCSGLAVGYARAAFYADSSAAHAFRNACENYARQMHTRLAGGQAFWSTEIGTFWLGADFVEEFDSTAAVLAEKSLQPLDTLSVGDFVAVLASPSGCQLPPVLEQKTLVAGRPAPGWTEAPPDDPGYYYVVGVAPEYFYEMSSWIEAERLARRNLARAVFIEVMAYQKLGAQGQEIRHEELSVALHNIEVMGRWRDLNNRLFYVLIRMPRSAAARQADDGQ